MIQFVQGNLLQANVEAVVNTVNTVGAMGKGLALQLKKAFPDNNKAYEAACKRGEVEVGRMFVHQVGGVVLPRYVINFPTKRHWRSPAKLEYIDKGLDDLIRVVRDRSIQSIAIPPLGAGLGRLDWKDVRALLEVKLAALHDVDVLVFEPGGAPAAEAMRNETKRPNMTRGRAAMLALMNRYLVPGYDYRLSLLEVQKLAYFLQEAGEPLRLEYAAHYYGPYADNLRHVLSRIEGHYIQGFGDGENKPTTSLTLLGDSAKHAESFLEDDRDLQKRFERVSELIEGFETPFGLELLSTVHWVAPRNNAASASVDDVVSAVHAWNDRKASMMEPLQIRAAWEQLRRLAWI